MKLIAYDITNLTDARYFAARGAFMMGFSSEESSIEEVNAIKEWVDIPEFFIRVPLNVSAETVWEWQERTGIKRFLIENLSDDISTLFPDTVWMSYFSMDHWQEEMDIIFISPEQIDSWKKERTNSSMSYDEIPCFLLCEDDDSFDFVKHLPIRGIAIKGGAEDKVGLKSYEKTDDFLDAIEIEY